MNVDQEYLDKNCRHANNVHLCKRNQPTHSKLGIHDCAAEVINHSNQIAICQFVIFIQDIRFDLHTLVTGKSLHCNTLRNDFCSYTMRQK